jgi:hypothetical protein
VELDLGVSAKAESFLQDSNYVPGISVLKLTGFQAGHPTGMLDA